MDINSEKYIAHADDSLETAKILLRADKYIGCVNRSYYAMFYCAQAMLSALRMFPRTHQGTATKFSEHFIKTEAIDKKFGTFFKSAFEKRQLGDYDMDSNITQEEAQEILNNANAFVEMARNYFNKP